MLKKKKNNYTQSFSVVVDEYALDEKKKQLFVKGKIDLQEQANANRDTAFDRILDKFLKAGGDVNNLDYSASESQYGEFENLDNASYLIELQDMLEQYDGELYDANLSLADKKAIFDAESSKWLKEYADKQKEEKKAEIEPKKEENNTQEEVDKNA